MSQEGNNNNNRPRKNKPIVGTPNPERDAIHQERRYKVVTSGKRRTNQGVLTEGENSSNFMKVIKDKHERRKILDNESIKGLPQELIYKPKEPLKAQDVFKDERALSKPDKPPITKRKV